MTNGSVVLLGSLPEAPALLPLVQELGWTLEIAAGFDQLRDLSSNRKPVAVFFDANALNISWQEALTSVREIAPEALLIPCHRFSDVLNWPDLADSGAFHSLAIPFNPGEVRQSLAFVWSARLHRAANVIPMRRRSAAAKERDPGSERGSFIA
jgi:DNA-binding NtrC family response regulator